MKSNVLIFSVLFSMLFFSSCSTTNKAYQSSPILSRSVELDPIKADIEVDETKKLKGESKSAYLLFFRLTGDKKYADNIKYSSENKFTTRLFSFLNPFYLIKLIATGDALGKVKAAAAYKALENTDADVLVHPVYNITEKNFLLFYIFKAEVTGYAGKYKNFRSERQKTVIIDGGKEFTFPELNK